MRTQFLIALSGLFILGAEAQAQVARQEVHAFQSMTLSDADFLNGKKDGVPVTLAAHLRLPKVGAEKLPAVVFLSGSGGLGGSGSTLYTPRATSRSVAMMMLLRSLFGCCMALQTTTCQSLPAEAMWSAFPRAGRTFV